MKIENKTLKKWKVENAYNVISTDHKSKRSVYYDASQSQSFRVGNLLPLALIIRFAQPRNGGPSLSQV